MNLFVWSKKIQEIDGNSQFKALQQIISLLKQGYLISETSYNRGESSKLIMIKLKAPEDAECGPDECSITVFGEEAKALSKLWDFISLFLANASSSTNSTIEQESEVLLR